MRLRPGARGVLAAVTVLASGGCLPDGLVRQSEPSDPGRVQVRSLGVGGFVIRRGRDVVMTAPLYSNPTPLQLAGETRPRTEILDRFYREHGLAADMPDLRAILVGHGHYDHLMDVPYFVDKATVARVYGSVTTRRILAGYGPAMAARVTALDDPAHSVADFSNCLEPGGDGCETAPGVKGQWVDVPGTDGRVRIQAFCSCHPAQVLHAIHFWPGCQAHDLAAPPARADDYKEGEVFAYLVDFMENGAPAFRVYYQDAPVSRPIGWVRQELVDARPVDLALLCVGNFDVMRRPEEVVSANLRARDVVLHHWEDFFDPDHASLKPIPGCDVNAFRKAVLAEVGGDPAHVQILAPGVQLNFPRPSRSAEAPAPGVPRGASGRR